MPIDKNKITEAATKYIQKGQLDKAIKEYRKILVADPKDARIQQKLGELYARNGDSAQAIECFQKVAEGYTTDGFLLKAIAVYKQIIKINPDRVDINFILAQLHQQLGLLGDAMAQYQAIVAHDEAAGNLPACLETLHKIVELDPDNTVMRIKLAELCVKQSMTDDAVQELLKVKEYFKKNNRTDDYIKISERIVFLDPTRIDLIQELAAQYLSMGEAQRALAKLQICFRANPKDIETLSLLARAFQMSGEIPKTASIYKELARIYGTQNQTRLEKETWNKVLQLVPNDPEALSHLHPEETKAAAVPATPSRPPAPAPVAKPVDQGAKPAVQQTAANLTRLLSETDVYIKYGLLDKALEHLDKLFEQYSDSLEAHERAAKIYLSRTDLPTAFRHLLEIIRLSLASGDKSRARAAFEQFSQACPDHPELPRIHASIETGSPLPSDLKLDVPPAAGSDLEVIEIAEIVEDGQDTGPQRIPSDHAIASQSSDSPATTHLSRFGSQPPVAEVRFGSRPPTAGARFGSQHSPVPVMEELDDSAFLPPENSRAFEASTELPVRRPSQLTIPDEEEDVDWTSLSGAADDVLIEEKSTAALASQEFSPAPQKLPPPSPSPDDDVDWASLGEEDDVLELKATGEEGPANSPPSHDDAIDWASLDDDESLDASSPNANEVPPTPDTALPSSLPSTESSPSHGDAIDWASLDDDVSKAGAAILPTALADFQTATPSPEPLTFAEHFADASPVPTPILPTDHHIDSSQVEAYASDVMPTVDHMEASAAQTSELDDILDEAAFFINQGDLGEAREVLSTASLAYPDSDRVQEMASLLEAHEQYYAEQQAAFEQAVAAEAAMISPEEIAPMQMALPRLSTDALFEPDLQERVAQSTPQDGADYQVSFEDVFSEFKKGIEQIVRPEDIETHYDLGLSYREMDLFDDAISEFQQAKAASRGQPKELDCLTMIAICQISANRFDVAEQTLHEGLASPLLTPASESALRFELASLYERQDRPSDALKEFLRIAQYDANYRDVGTRIAKLQSAAG